MAVHNDGKLKIVPPPRTPRTDGITGESGVVDGGFDQVLNDSRDTVVQGQDPAANLAGVTGPQSFSVSRIFDNDSTGDLVAKEKALAVMDALLKWFYSS